ncbi:MAG TPA: DUF1499 domain-containing protein [Gammaproteobacteria bacterium]
MKTVIYPLLILIFIPCLFLALMSATARVPKTGLGAGKLRACPDSPNCVVSENANAKSQIKPLAFDSEATVAWLALQRVIEQSGGKVQQEQNGYLWATFTSRVFRFVDDVEFRLDITNKMIQLRSASRTGYSDFGVNRKRIERLRAAFAEVLK